MKSRTLTCFIVTLFAALALPFQLAAQHTTSGTNGQIAFTRQITTDIAGVFTAKPDGSDEQQVPSGEPIGLLPAHSRTSREGGLGPGRTLRIPSHPPGVWATPSSKHA